MWTPMVVEAEIGREGSRSSHRTPIGPAIRPFTQQRLDEALSLPIRLGMTRSTADEADPDAGRDLGEDVRPVGAAIVGQDPFDGDPCRATNMN